MMKKKLVAYFSASGVTANVANRQSRSSVEMTHKDMRPAIANQVENMAQYDRIYIGFPKL